jgi:hypothetical protein
VLRPAPARARGGRTAGAATGGLVSPPPLPLLGGGTSNRRGGAAQARAPRSPLLGARPYLLCLLC